MTCCLTSLTLKGTWLYCPPLQIATYSAPEMKGDHITGYQSLGKIRPLAAYGIASFIINNYFQILLWRL
jgi:hypothetical protein